MTAVLRELAESLESLLELGLTRQRVSRRAGERTLSLLFAETVAAARSLGTAEEQSSSREKCERSDSCAGAPTSSLDAQASKRGPRTAVVPRLEPVNHPRFPLVDLLLLHALDALEVVRAPVAPSQRA